MFESIDLTKIQNQTVGWVESNLLSIDSAVQAGLVVTALIIGLLVRKIMLPKITPQIDRLPLHARMKTILRNIARLIMQLVAIIVLVIGIAIAASFELETGFADAVMALFAAWVVIRLVVQFINNSVVRNLFALTIWVVAALSIMGVLEQTTATLDAVGMDIGEFRLSALSIIKSLVGVFILLYGALFLSSFLERKIQTVPGLTISSRVLIGKVLRVTLVVVALVIAITSAGIDLSLFAVFSGAVGLGVGFGLQKGISNLFSGMMLLMDQSIKPGDIIELPGVGGENTFGWVEHMGARYTEIITRDNKSFLIPNEDFITQQVTNWSHGNTMVRIEVKFGVSYHHDPHMVKEIAEGVAAQAHERICKDQSPVCHLTEFGDSSLNFKLRFWIRDAEKGVTNMRGAVMLGLWDAFKEHNISIPYPHREVFLHDPAAIPRANKANKKAVSKPKKNKDTA
jgi:small-conductance mechanosensitive channel